jgi:hypothetical protein
MEKKRFIRFIVIVGFLFFFDFTSVAFGISDVYKENIYKLENLKPVDSVLKVKIGDRAPQFTLPAVSGEKV